MSVKVNRTIVSCLVFLLWGCRSIPPPALQGTIHHPKTTDGWSLTLEHFPPLPNSAPKRWPVLACHGIMINRNHYKINDDRSFTAALQKEGYDVWLMDLRGRKDADDTSLFWGERTFSYSFDDYVLSDLDTALTYVTAQTGKSQVNWVGHSMGGMVMYARLGSMPETRVASLITFGSPFFFDTPSNSLKTTTSFLGGLSRMLPVLPAASVAGFEARSGLSFLPHRLLMALFYNRENMPPGSEAQLKAWAVEGVAPLEAKQLSTAIGTDSLYDLRHQVNYAANLSKIQTPAFLMAGRVDHLGSPSVVSRVYSELGSSDKSLHVFGRDTGTETDYGHADLITGTRAPEEVFPLVLSWLNQRN